MKTYKISLSNVLDNLTTDTYNFALLKKCLEIGGKNLAKQRKEHRENIGKKFVPSVKDWFDVVRLVNGDLIYSQKF